MRRSKRKTSGGQAAAVAAVCILFVLTALFGLYKCFSKEPTPKPALPVGGALPGGEADAAVMAVIYYRKLFALQLSTVQTEQAGRYPV